MTLPRTLLRLAALGGLLTVPVHAQEVVEDAVCVDTNSGEFCMELYPEAAPATVANFLRYVTEGDYDNTFLHRNVYQLSNPPFRVVQGGGYLLDPLGEEVAKDPAVVNEPGLSNTRGTVAMAKMAGDPNSATSEWFVNVSDNTFLDSDNGGFTVFGRIIRGMDVVERINNSRTVDLSASLGAAFNSVPVLPGTPVAAVGIEHLLQVQRMYVSDVIPVPPCGVPADANNAYPAVATLQNTRIVLPLHWVDKVVGATFQCVDVLGAPVFRMNLDNIVRIDNPPAELAVYDPASGLLSLPSVNVGSHTFANVVLRVTNRTILEFQVESYERLTP